MINVNLVGNPNTGKTTLFNNLTNSHEHVGNWHGVTVEEKAKIYDYKKNKINLVDLPGIYSLTPLSYEEDVACKYILEHKDRLTINICDASNIQRNLYLTLGLMELGCKIILVVNQIDKRPICKINYSLLEKLLGIKVVYVNASDKKSLNKLNDMIISQSYDNKYTLPYIKNLDFSKLDEITSIKKQNLSIFEKIKLIEDDENIKNKYKINICFNQMEDVSYERYNYIDFLVDKCVTNKVKVYGYSKLDKILLNRFLAFPIFLLFISLSFYITFFSVGSFFSDCLSFLLEKFVANPLTNLMITIFGQNSWIVNLFDVAIIGGVGSILSFLPQVALLFFFLSLLEDSGYLARVAFVFEDILGKVGLSGKSVYTLLMGFGCSTTAVLTARNMEDKNSKIKTALLTPYMSCSAKFPIYAVIGGAFFGVNNIFVIIALYLLGIFIAILMSLFFEKTFLKSKKQSFILEFPPYRLISIKRTISLLWLNIKLFFARVGTLILAMNIIVWILSNFSFTFQYVANGNGISMLESLGKIISPIFIPLGFGNWGLSAALIAGLVAKEVIISSISMFNNINENSVVSLGESLHDESFLIHFNSGATVLSYLVFCLLYFPCIATLSILNKEIGRKWTIIGVIIELIIAYLISFFVYTFARLSEIYTIAFVLSIFLTLLIFVISCVVILNKIKNKKVCNKCPNCKK